MRGPGGCVLSKRLMAITGLLIARTIECAAAARGRKESVDAGRRLDVVDDPLARGVHAVGDERLVADRAKSMHPIGWECDRHPGLERDDPALAIEPGLATALEHGQHLGIGVRMKPRLIARR